MRGITPQTVPDNRGSTCGCGCICAEHMDAPPSKELREALDALMASCSRKDEMNSRSLSLVSKVASIWKAER